MSVLTSFVSVVLTKSKADSSIVGILLGLLGAVVQGVEALV